MLQDILHGHKTEIGYLNGAVVDAGRRLGIPTPYNSCITDLVRFIESTGKPGPHAPGALPDLFPRAGPENTRP
jgi:2-dehydropantoate 2-reductase